MKKHIVLVEDDPAIQDAIQMILEGEGYEVALFQNGEPLLAGAFDVPNLFLLDKQLAGVDGLDVCRFLKGNPETIGVPVVMLSASPHIARLAKEAGASGFLEKPFKKQELLSLVERFA